MKDVLGHQPEAHTDDGSATVHAQLAAKRLADGRVPHNIRPGMEEDEQRWRIHAWRCPQEPRQRCAVGARIRAVVYIPEWRFGTADHAAKSLRYTGTGMVFKR